MSTKITIWNMALGFIGTRTIASEEEKTLEAVQCQLYWDSARRSALRDFPWNFAQRRAWLAEVPMPTGYEEHYSHAYALPEDLLHASGIFSTTGYMSSGQQTMAMQGRALQEQPFVLVHHGQYKNHVLLCHVPKALLAYTADVDDVSLFDDCFTLLLARKLAAMIAVSLLKNNAARVQELEEMYKDALPKAMQADSTEGTIFEKPDSWLVARRAYACQ